MIVGVQIVRNIFFYFSPLIGAVLGWWIGLSHNIFSSLIESLIGFGGGCLVSIVMIVLSVRARFKSDVTLTQNTLGKESAFRPIY